MTDTAVMDAVEVALGARSYEIAIGSGLLDAIGSRIATLRPGARVAVVSDERVAGHYLERVKTSVAAAGVELLAAVSVPEGEASKSSDAFIRVSEALLEAGVERGDLIIALGGGVVGDLAGYVAACLRRGVDFVQVPTSLLAQVDSSVGGKTGINAPQGKNLIGAFHQPLHVLIDVDVLTTLSDRHFAAGFAEVTKYGLLGDRAFFDWLTENRAAIFQMEGGPLGEAIKRSCAAKAAVVAEDEREHGQRALLNLGHTFGHALEAWCGYSDRLLHGEAIAIGMVLAFAYSERIGVCAPGRATQVAAFFAECGLPTRISDIDGETLPDRDALMRLMLQDKKVERGALTLILACDIGEAYVARDVAQDDLAGFLDEMLAA